MVARRWGVWRLSTLNLRPIGGALYTLFLPTMNGEDMVSLVTEQISSNETMFLLPILLDAEEGEERIRAALLDPTCTAYAARLEGQLAGAAVVRWEEDQPSEIIYIAVAEALRGHGYG